METKYGDMPDHQISSLKVSLRKAIFFLLLYVDPKTKSQYENINVDEAFMNLQYRLHGLNKILKEPQELIIVMSLLESAWDVFKSNDFDFNVYRKLILDAGAEMTRIREDG